MLENTRSNFAPAGSVARSDREPIILAHEPPFRIGHADFRPSTREVVFDNRTAVVEPRVMQVLVALHRASGAVVSKDDLAALCWQDRIVGEDAINRVVSRLRSVAETQAGGQFRVETITKVGYRLLASAQSAGDTTVFSAVNAASAPMEIGRRSFIAGGAVVALAAAGSVTWKLLRKDTSRPEVELLLAESRQALNEGTVEQLSNAIGRLRHATQLAPARADAWGLLALAYTRYAEVAPSGQRADLYARSLAAERGAFALEAHQADALAAQLLRMPFFRNWYAYEKACRAALRYHPTHPDLVSGLSGVLLHTGRTREALDASVANMASPRVQGCRAVALWDLGRLDEAEDVLNESLAQWPRYYGLWFTKVYYLMYDGRATEASAMVANTDMRPVGIPDWNFDLVALQTKALENRDPEDIRKSIDAFGEAAHKGTGFAENGAIFAAFVGDVDEAFRLLDALYFDRGFRMPDTYFSKEQAMYSARERHTYNLFHRPIAAIRRDPRFAVLTREIGLDDYWRRTNSRSLVIA